MPPKGKDDKKKGALATVAVGAVYTITEEELEDAKNLPYLNDFIFCNLYAFKNNRNQKRVAQMIKKEFCYTNPEEPDYSEEFALKFRTIEMH